MNSSIKILDSIYLAGLSVCMENGLQEFKLSLLSASIKSHPATEISPLKSEICRFINRKQSEWSDCLTGVSMSPK